MFEYEKKNALGTSHLQKISSHARMQMKKIGKKYLNSSSKPKAFSAYILINSEAGSEKIVLEKLKLRGINDIHKVLGAFHIIIKIEADYKDELRKLLHQIRCLDGIRSTLTLMTRDKEANPIECTNYSH